MKIIVGINKQNGIGFRGSIPWREPDDLKFFREKTKGNVVIMGRKTFKSIGKVLPNRVNIVVSSQEIKGVETYKTLDKAIEKGKKYGL